jgi:hypothetical protein
VTIHRFQTPDGVIHRVEAPTREAAEAELNRVLKIAPAARDDYERGRAAGAGHVAGWDQTFAANVPFMDEFKAGSQALIDTAQGKGSFRENWAGQRAYQKGARESYQEQHPIAANSAKAAGYGVQAAPAFLSGGATVAPNVFAQSAKTGLLGAAERAAPVVGRNALAGGAYTAGNVFADEGSLGERVTNAGHSVLPGMALGAAVPLVVGAPGAAVRGGRNIFAPKAGSPGATLADIGVSTTPLQRGGKGAKGLEDLGRRAPILGQAMAGYQERQLGQLNRGIGLKALQRVGGSIPKEIKPGFEMVDYVDGELGKVYQQAAKMVPRVALDEPLVADAARIGARRVDLSESEARQWDSIVADRLTRLKSGEASGETIKDIHSELGGLQREQARKGNDTMASMLGALRQAMMGTVARANPEAAKLIAKADEGWRIYSMMNDAAAAASNRGGVFLPGQLNTQVRRAGNAMGSNMTGKGKAPYHTRAQPARPFSWRLNGRHRKDPCPRRG